MGLNILPEVQLPSIFHEDSRVKIHRRLACTPLHRVGHVIFFLVPAILPVRGVSGSRILSCSLRMINLHCRCGAFQSIKRATSLFLTVSRILLGASYLDKCSVQPWTVAPGGGDGFIPCKTKVCVVMHRLKCTSVSAWRKCHACMNAAYVLES